MIADLINNTAFLIALVAARQIVVALLGMVNPVHFSPGVLFDGRSIVLAVADVVGGGGGGAVPLPAGW